MEDHVLIFREAEVNQADEVLRALLADSHAKCALLISRIDGSLISKQGPTDNLDVTSLAALAAGGFAATKEIARLVGEPEFSILFHQGEMENIYVSLVGEFGLLMLLFDEKTTIGLVRVLARESNERLSAIFTTPHPVKAGV
jgi:predicted regulator of Ras-like GTPase activity (Roadblock/LC7/MglB family)